ncbi:MAG: proline dehydrogenase family protein [Thaumarchaeota archaeon]|nr:proline dehydrogenase family protein [Nitrososphaerota archaeon]
MGLKQDLVYRVARRWISGKDLSGGIEGARHANAAGMSAILNYLGEDVPDSTAADREFDEYLALQTAIHRGDISGCVSVKLTQVGLMVDRSFLMEKIEALASNAESMHQFLWLDMEGSRFTEDTIEVYLKLLQAHPLVGLALQAYMKRSEGDLSKLLDAGARVRLVKGAYREPHGLVLSSKEEVRRNYSKLMTMLFDRGKGFAIGTHDSSLIDQARAISSDHRADFEFQMLKGIRDDLKPGLIAAGFKVAEYIPYGDQWYPYSMRRMKEHPSNLWLLLRSML